MSLRRRLALLTVGVFLAGLAVLAVLVPSLVRDFLYQRLDDELRNSGQAAARAIWREQRLAAIGDLGTDGLDIPFFPPRPETPTALNDSYVELRDADGAVIESFFADPDVGDRAPPDLPNEVTVGEPFEVGSVSGPTNWRTIALEAQDMDGSPMSIVVAVPTTDVEATVTRVRWVILWSSLATLGGLAVVTWLAIGVGLRPLRAMERSAAAISDADDLGWRVDHPSEKTEIGRLGATINGMLARLEGSFAAQQESETRLRCFVADASHELRTPLTSIRGYAELYRRGGRDTVQIARSMERIEGEGARMSLLVDDLLLLARFDEGLAIVHEPVDLTSAVTDIVDDARATQPERTISLIAAPASTTGDRHRLTQAIANLLANTRIHTPAHTPVEVRVVTAGDTAMVSVADHGPGLAGQESKVFDRFHRIDASRTRTHGGSGLGLAITKSIVEAHGGVIVAERTPGGGATFVVRLPASAPSPPVT